MTIDDIRNILDNEPLIKEIIIKGKTPWQYNKNQNIVRQLNSKYDINLNSFMELVYLIKYRDGLENLHIFCLTCKNKNNFLNINLGYSKFCCVSCSSKNIETIKLSKKTRYLKYNNENYNNSKKIVQTSRNNIDELGRNSYDRMVIHNKESKQRNRGNSNYNNSEKAHYTKLININENGENSYQRAARKTKLKKKEKYNDENYCNSTKIVNTRMNDIDESGKNSYQRAIIKGINTARYNIDENGFNGYQRGILKSKHKMLEEKGVEHYTQLPEYKEKFKDKLYVNQIVKKRYNTMKKNKSFNRRSKAEIRCYEKLLTKFPNSEHSYMDEKRYPFNCDMYIPELDLFIECHFGEFHYKKPFDLNNEEHSQRLIFLKNKEKEKLQEGKKRTRYSKMINVWTITDPLKLKTFQDNHLNYKIFYTEKEFNKWFNSL